MNNFRLVAAVEIRILNENLDFYTKTPNNKYFNSGLTHKIPQGHLFVIGEIINDKIVDKTSPAKSQSAIMSQLKELVGLSADEEAAILDVLAFKKLHNR